MFEREANVTHDVSFGHTLKQRRKALDLTREELAERVGCAVETLRKIETDARRPSRQMAERLADALALAPEERAAFVHLGRSSPAAVSLWTSSPTATQIAAPSLSRSLPSPPTPLIGRARELADVCERLLRADVRLLTLTGPPGVGKTRLSLQVASDLCDSFTQGAAFVALAPIRDPDLVASTIAQALEIKGRAPDRRRALPSCVICVAGASCSCSTTLSRWSPRRHCWSTYWRPLQR
jgi:transcriptional regulator with XRE-family HTH domain